MTAITDRLKGAAGHVVRIIAKFIVTVFSGICFVSSFTILQTQIASGQVSPGLHIPMFVPYFALPLSFGIITVVQIVLLVKLIFGSENGDGKEEKA